MGSCPACGGASGNYAKGVCSSCYCKRPEVRKRKRENYSSFYATPEGKARYRANRIRYSATPNGKASAYRKHRKHILKIKYGLTPEQASELFAANDGMCQICDVRTAVMIDHCHSSGAVRGALCSQCNTALGMLMDSTQLLQSAIDYLKENQ